MSQRNGRIFIKEVGLGIRLFFLRSGYSRGWVEMRVSLDRDSGGKRFCEEMFGLNRICY